MGLAWFDEDIRNVLLAANEGGNPSIEFVRKQIIGCYQEGALAAIVGAYRQGYKAALRTTALAFGVAPQAIGLEATQLETPDYLIGSEGEAKCLVEQHTGNSRR